MSSLQKHFDFFRKNTIGHDLVFNTPYREKPMVYADWIASGRLYRPIEEWLQNAFGSFVANTHTETSESGTLMTKSYHFPRKLIKQHVNAGPDYVIIAAGTGMIAVINEMIRIMGLKY